MRKVMTTVFFILIVFLVSCSQPIEVDISERSDLEIENTNDNTSNNNIEEKIDPSSQEGLFSVLENNEIGNQYVSPKPQIDELGDYELVPIKIGVLAPLSSDSYKIGRSCVNGIKLAQELWNEAYESENVLVEVYIYDTQGNLKRTQSLVEELIMYKQVDAILGPIIDYNAIQVEDYMQQYQMPVIFPVKNTNDETSGWAFSRPTSLKQKAVVIAKYLEDENLSEDVLILQNEDLESSKLITNVFFEEYRDKKSLVYYKDIFDIDRILSLIRSNDYSFILFEDDEFFGEAFLKALKDNNLSHIPIITGHSFIDSNKDLSPFKIYTIMDYYAILDSDKVENFEKLYYEFTGEKADEYGALAYESFNILVETLSKTPETNPSEIRSLIVGQTYEGIFGSIEFNSEGESESNVIVVRLDDEIRDDYKIIRSTYSE